MTLKYSLKLYWSWRWSDIEVVQAKDKVYLEELIENDRLEKDTFEAKAILNRDDVVGWLKTIAGFENASGGDFYIDVEDKTNKLIGFDRKSAENERNYFNNQVNEHLIPHPAMDISFLRYTINDKERYTIKVHVEDSIIKPVIQKYPDTMKRCSPSAIEEHIVHPR